MKIGLYSPYFPQHFGGGEKYFLDTANVLSRYGKVTLFIPQTTALSASQKENIFQDYERFLGHSIRSFALEATPLGTSAFFLKKLLWTQQFDLLYYVTDGSFFPSLARRNVMHIQVPLLRGPLTAAERLKVWCWHFINTNSSFTKKIVEQSWQLPVTAVHPPMVDVAQLQTLARDTKKEKIILHVGRFFRQLHSKRHDVLLSIFRDLRKKYPKESKGWKLVLIGLVEDESYAAEIHALAKGLPVHIIHTVTRPELNQWYAKASLYWHATGFGLEEARHPEKMEHFGISTVEAMAAGAIPVVIQKGGQPEILGEELAELLWPDKKACLEKTAALMNNTKKRQALVPRVQQRAQVFGPQAFEDRIAQMMMTLKEA